MDKTGRVDCQCGDQIISNSGKTVGPHAGIIKCWNPECGIAYDSQTIEDYRIDGVSISFTSPGKNLKVFKMNDCDWWMDKSLEDAKKNYPVFVGIGPVDCIENPFELTEDQLKSLKYHDVEREAKCSFLEELQKRQSITDHPEFFASTEH